MTRKGKLKAFLAVFAIIALAVGFQALRYVWFYGYATGTRTGFVRKITEKGPPYCKYIVGELVQQQGGIVSASSEVWEFSVDTKDQNAPIVQDLRNTEKGGKLATLRYRQDLHMWWRCTPSEYFVTAVEK